MISLTVARASAGTRLDLFLASELAQFSRARLQALIRDGSVLLNGKPARPRELVRTDDQIELTEPAIVKIETQQPEAIPLEILFEDDDLLVLNKPVGLVVHPGAGNREHTLVNALLAHCTNLSGIGGEERPGIVHRLDKDTSGCLVVAKNDTTHRELSKQFAERTTQKTYLALVVGIPKKSRGTIDAPIARHPVHRQRMRVSQRRGREAKTDYRVVQSGADMSLVECVLHSGRTHQIRVHLHHLGHPVLGDRLYGARQASRAPRQMLHAWKLGFLHPHTGQAMSFEAPVPDDFAEVMKKTRV